MAIGDLFGKELTVVNIGLTSFTDSLDDAHAASVQVDWKPPADVNPAALKTIRQNLAEIQEANKKAMDIILRGMPHLVGLERAIDVVERLLRLVEYCVTLTSV